MSKSERLKLIHKDTQGVLRGENKVDVQKPGFNPHERYSINGKINSIVRTLVALHGKNGLMAATRKYLMAPEGQRLSADEAFELYQAVKWTVQWEKVEAIR